MSEVIQAFPLQWPPGWRRSTTRTRAKFSKGVRKYSTSMSTGQSTSHVQQQDLSIADGRERVLRELQRMGIDGADLVISTNLPLRLDGLPRVDARNPTDPGVAVYWRKGKVNRCMAIDRYDRVTDNLAAIAATLEAMRAIERHGGAEILDRAFTGFVALAAPEQWFQVLGVKATASREDIDTAYRRLAMQHHPDREGGNAEQMARINQARDDGLEQLT
jgi:hypothetical protein